MKNDANAWKCVTCGADLHEALQAGIKPKNYMVFSVLLFLSCIPTAVISFIYGLKVNKSFLNGDYEKMEAYQQKARMWVWISFILGIIISIIFFSYFVRTYGSLNIAIDKQMKDLLRE